MKNFFSLLLLVMLSMVLFTGCDTTQASKIAAISSPITTQTPTVKPTSTPTPTPTPTPTSTKTPTPTSTKTPTSTPTKPSTSTETQNKQQSGSNTSNSGNRPKGRITYSTPTGTKYHYDPDCGGKNSRPTTNISGLSPCKKCAQ